jgi:deoxyribodipyrimidine photo-lyase
MINIFWFRRDLRIEDNHGLFEALNDSKTLPIFIFDVHILEELEKNDARVSFIHQNLQKIHKQLNGSFKIYYGKPLEVWQEIVEKYDIKSVFFNKDYEPYALQRDAEVKQLLSKKGVEIKSYKDQVIFEENEILKGDGTPYTIYTPFKNKWLAAFNSDLTRAFKSEKRLQNLIPETFKMPSLEDLSFEQSTIKVPPFTFENLDHYEKVRNIPSLNQTSALSTHLRFGTISVRQALSRAKSINETFLNELIWREFFMQTLYHTPRVISTCFKLKYETIKWRNNEAEFQKWCDGETGYPMVDSGMRQLNETGLMHNRVRMVTASFLVKHLLIDWRCGEAYFASKLLDYDLSANNGNWQWAAGTGCDSAPYFRIFNPTEQQKKFDPQLSYVRKWVKNFDELTYPLPMVEHKFARERCLKVYKEALA